MGAKDSKPVSETNKSGDVVTKFEWPAASWKNINSYEAGQCLTKEVVVVGGSGKDSFDVCLYPHGYNERTKHCVSLWMKKKNPEKELIVELCCSVVVGGKEIVRRTVREHLIMESVMGWSSFCSRSVIMNDSFSGLRDDSLLLRFRLTVFGPESFSNPELEDEQETFLKQFSNDFRHLLSDRILCDVKLLLVDKLTIPAHKAILASRSDFFRQYYFGFVTLPTIPSPSLGVEQFKVVMQYIYSGTVDFLNVEDYERVYRLSRNYGLFNLGHTCRKMITDNLRSENVVGRLLMAHDHDDFELEESCLRFIDSHLRDIKGRPEWIELMRTFPQLADKALFFIERRKRGSESSRSFFRLRKNQN